MTRRLALLLLLTACGCAPPPAQLSQPCQIDNFFGTDNCDKGLVCITPDCADSCPGTCRKRCAVDADCAPGHCTTSSPENGRVHICQ